MTRRVLTDAEYAEAVALKKSGEMTTEQIATRFGIAKASLHRRFKREGVDVDGKAVTKAADTVVAGIKEASLAELSRQIEMIQETRETHYKIAKSLTGLSMKIVQDAVKGGVKLENVLDDLKAVKVAMDINAMGKTVRYEILKIDAETTNAGDIAILPIQELSDEQAREFAKSKSGLDFDEDDLIGTGEDGDADDVTEAEEEAPDKDV